MLAAHRMGSHGGQQNFPFGYNPHELHGIGLPDFMTPGPPPGRPLLDEHENQTLDSFFNGFDMGGDAGKDGSLQHFPSAMDQNQNWIMPPTFVGSETSLGHRSGNEWQNLPMSEFTVGSDLNVPQMPQSSIFSNGGHRHQHFPGQASYDNNLLQQLQTAASAVQTPYHQGWHQPYPVNNTPHMQQTHKSVMRFGSDAHFQPTGYAAPDGNFDHDEMPNLDWLKAQSSTPNTQSNTQPNTRPSTQPSSPNVPRKKRKLDESQDSHLNGFASATNGHSAKSQASPAESKSHQKKMFVKHEPTYATSQPPTPISAQLPQEVNVHIDEDAGAEEDADYDEEDDDPQQSLTPVSFPHKPKSFKGSRSSTSTKPARGRKRSLVSNTPAKLKSKSARSSTGDAATSRVPLSADQKKANHTNSEQRRRDATARAYAELYDLVPELDEMGKQSTMKKLEIVVAKVAKVKNRVIQLRALLGVDPGSTGTIRSDRASFPSTTSAPGGIPGSYVATEPRGWQR